MQVQNLKSEQLSGNGEWKENRIPSPTTCQAEVWTASYSAGRQDTSVWKMTYKNSGKGPSAKLRLIR
jgi:hypothetical protein